MAAATFLAYQVPLLLPSLSSIKHLGTVASHGSKPKNHGTVH